MILRVLLTYILYELFLGAWNSSSTNNFEIWLSKLSKNGWVRSFLYSIFLPGHGACNSLMNKTVTKGAQLLMFERRSSLVISRVKYYWFWYIVRMYYNRNIVSETNVCRSVPGVPLMPVDFHMGLRGRREATFNSGLLKPLALSSTASSSS